jgi:arylsulfatase A-like enzyme/Tfp pilus assembly protein PilF
MNLSSRLKEVWRRLALVPVLSAVLAMALAGWAVWHVVHRRTTAQTSATAAASHHHSPRLESVRNVLLISIDTCRADRLSCYGYPRKSTPNIDAVAREAVLFQQAIAPAPMTLPSHSSMMTGTYPPVHGVRANDGYRLAESNMTLARLLRDAGYQTAAFVGGFPLDARFGLNQGFQTYDGRFGAEGGSHDRRTAEEVTRRGLAWLDAQNKEPDKKPFFLFLHYYDAHWPYQPPPPFDKTFADDPYAGGIAYVDASIGRVVGRLRESGLYDNTLIIIVGDHGESLGEHGERTHSFFTYQSTLRVPLVVRAPGLGGGREVQQAVNLVDLMPTTLSLLGQAQPERIEGTDLRDCLEGKPRQGPPPIGYFESLEPAAFNCCPLQGVLEGRWKYIRAPRPELYDLDRDPNEQQDLAAKEVATARRLRDRLEEMLETMKSAAAPGGSALMDREASARLQSLGYVGGPVERSEFDPRSEDPKDFGPVAAKVDQANEFNRTHRFQEAKKVCLEIVAMRPNLVPPYLILGEYANREQRPDEAVALLSKALSILKDAKKSKTVPSAVENHQIAAIRSHLGISLLMQGKMEESVAELLAALALEPDSADLQYDVGNVRAAQGKTDEAIGYYRKALELDPKYSDAHHNLGTSLAALGRVDEAISHYEKALEITPRAADVHAHLADALLLRGRVDEAVAHYRKALEIKSDNLRVQVSLADILAGRGEGDEAIAHYRKALEIKPDDADALNNLGLCLAGRGQLDEAITLYRKTLEVRPDYAPAHNNLGLAFAARGKYDEAIGHYEKAIAIKPDFAAAHNNLGAALAAGRGQMAEAIKHFQKALEIQPNYVGARQNLERARSKQ